jgi:hypothetical protein
MLDSCEAPSNLMQLIQEVLLDKEGIVKDAFFVESA